MNGVAKGDRVLANLRNNVVAALVRDAARSGSRFRGLVECGASAANLPEPQGRLL